MLDSFIEPGESIEYTHKHIPSSFAHAELETLEFEKYYKLYSHYCLELLYNMGLN